MSTIRLLPADRNVIIAMGSIIGAVILFIFVYSLWKRWQSPKLPLPPKGLLEFERRQRTVSINSSPDRAASFTRFPPAKPRPLRDQIRLQDVQQYHNSGHSFLDTDTSTIATGTGTNEPNSPAGPLGHQGDSHSQLSSSLDLIVPIDSSPPILKATIPRKTSTNSIRSHVDSFRSHGPPTPTFRGIPHRQPMDIVLPRPLALTKQPSSSTFNSHI